jgi:hypothetical protein
MNAYSEALYRYIQEHPLKQYDVEIESILEMFYDCYAMGGPGFAGDARMHQKNV